MDESLSWLQPEALLAWVGDNPWLIVIAVLVIAGVLGWRIRRGSVGARRLVVNVLIIGFLVWGTLWFTDWVRPSLTAEQLFTPPVLGPQPVTVAFVTRKSIEKTATYTGSVHPYERVVVNARSNGFVEEVNVYPGDRVKAGRVLARLETTELEPRLEHVMAELAYLRAELKRDRELVRDGVISSSKMELSESKARVARARAKLIKTEIGYATVVARSGGWVSERYVDPGQYVQKGQQLVAYDRLEQVRVRFDVAERDLANVRIGSDLILEFPQIPRERFAHSPWQDRLLEEYNNSAIRAQVTAIFPKLHEQTRLGVVEALLPNPDRILRSNTYVIGHLVTARVDDAWVVPERALTPMPGDKTVVFLGPAFADQGEVEMREVEVGLRNGRDAQITSGLEENAYVVIAGNRNLTEGEAVMVMKREGGLF
jgi:RND family efflux transporter MFP subunit